MKQVVNLWLLWVVNRFLEQVFGKHHSGFKSQVSVESVPIQVFQFQQQKILWRKIKRILDLVSGSGTPEYSLLTIAKSVSLEKPTKMFTITNRRILKSGLKSTGLND